MKNLGPILVIVGLLVCLQVALPSAADPAEGLPSDQWTYVLMEPDASLGKIVAGTRDGEGLYTSADGGQSFVADGNGLSLKRASSLVYDSASGIAYAGTWGDGVYARADGQSSWSQADDLVSGFNYLYSLAVGPQGDVVGADPDLYFYWLPPSKDGWHQLTTSGLPDSSDVLCLYFDANSTLYAGLTVVRGLYKLDSPYTGTWQQVGDTDDDLEIHDIAQGPGGTMWIGTTRGAYRWVGDNWMPVDDSPQVITSLEANPQVAQEIWAGTLSGEVWRYREDGSGWLRVDDWGIPADTRVRDFGFGTQGRLLVATDKGLYTRTGVVLEPTPMPTATLTPSPELPTPVPTQFNPYPSPQSPRSWLPMILVSAAETK